MLTISAEEMQKDIFAYLRLVKTGETLVITQGSEPVAEVKPLARFDEVARPFGLCAGQFQVPEDFDAPLPAELISPFEG